MIKKILILIVLIFCGTNLYFWTLSDSKIITRSTESLIECLEKEAGSGRLSGAISTSTFRDLLDDDIVFQMQRKDIPYKSLVGEHIVKGDLVQIVSGLSQSDVAIKITDKKITILSLDDEKASVKVSFHITTEKLPKNLDLDINCDLTYIKVEDDWRVSKVVVK